MGDGDKADKVAKFERAREDNMAIPKSILSVLQKISESEERWKALYMATWATRMQ